MNKNEAESVIKETIEYANDEITKTKKKARYKLLIAACATAAAVILIIIAGYAFANSHYTYVPYEDSGITCVGNEMRTTRNYAQFIGVNVTYQGENIEFIFLCSSPISNRTALKGETIIENFEESAGSYSGDDETEIPVFIDKVYYLPESAINNLPFVFSTGYMPVDLTDVDAGRLMEDSTLIWARE